MKKLFSIVAALAVVVLCGARTKRTVVIDPGHSHASIVQNKHVPGLSDTVFVYAPDCPELDQYLESVNHLNTLKKNPRHWVTSVYRGADYLEKVPVAGKGDFVVVSGNNRKKTEYILKAVELGYNVMADKPMAITPEDFPLLEKAYSQAEAKELVIFDMMTERYNVLNVLTRELISDRKFFGKVQSFAIDDTHFFYKKSAKGHLVRPDWYYDIRQQGEGIADVTTHFIDLAFWECFPEKNVSRKMISHLSSSHYPTVLTPEQFTASTTVEAYPDFLKEYVKDGNLHVMCNGEIRFKAGKIPVRVGVKWGFEPPEGSGDTFSQVIVGKKSSIRIVQDKSTSFKRVMYVDSSEKAIMEMSAKLSEKMPYVHFEKVLDGCYKVVIDTKTLPGEMFKAAMVVPTFLAYLDGAPMSSWETVNTLTKYYITTESVCRANDQEYKTK